MSQLLEFSKVKKPLSIRQFLIYLKAWGGQIYNLFEAIKYQGSLFSIKKPHLMIIDRQKSFVKTRLGLKLPDPVQNL
jgi:hypothetical protein